MEKKNDYPFSDVSAQTSEFIQRIIAGVMPPLLTIYEIGVNKECSHYKHVVRLYEKVLLTPKGQKIEFPFDAEKSEKAKKNFSKSGITQADRIAVVRAWGEIFKQIDELLLSEEATDAYDRFAYICIQNLTREFAAGTNVAGFHKKKVVLLDMYNSIVPLATKTDFNSGELKKQCASLGIPLVA